MKVRSNEMVHDLSSVQFHWSASKITSVDFLEHSKVLPISMKIGNFAPSILLFATASRFMVSPLIKNFLSPMAKYFILKTGSAKLNVIKTSRYGYSYR